MGVPGALQVTLQAPSRGATIMSWSLPAFVVPARSGSVMMVTGKDLVIIKPRIAEELKIKNNDNVDFLVNEIGESWCLKVKIRDDISSDVLIHDLITLKLAERVMVRYTENFSGGEVKLTSGKQFRLPTQEMWAGMKIIQKKGSAKLYFDGASQNNPHGPCGYGFHIENDDNTDTLVQGSGYSGMEKSNNQMEYEGLIEGLIWALRLDLKNLTIAGDSELVIKQMTGEYSVKNNRLKVLNEKVHDMFRNEVDLEVNFMHIPREENKIADSLANQAIVTRVNVTMCNWSNINRLMATNM